MYDSIEDTRLHIDRVGDMLDRASDELIQRGSTHDLSKLRSPEKEIFDEYTPKLRNSTYGSPEYKEFLKEMKVALDHHYANNSHHPEHYEERGMSGFDLFDLLEMLIDWKAATERHADGDIFKSIELNQERFGYPDMIKDILYNTAERYFIGEGW